MSAPELRRAFCSPACGVLLLGLSACDDKGGEEAKGDAAPAAAAKAEGDAKAEDGGDEAEPAKKKREKKDRGDASMKIGDVAWEASSAKAKIAGTKLTIRASSMDMTGGKAKRQELHLNVDGYAGPGDYETGFSGSMFIGVGFDIDAAKAAQKDDAKTTKLAADALTGSEHLMLMKAKVHVESVSDTEMVGTFSWAPPPGLKQPALSDGKFRALVDER